MNPIRPSHILRLCGTLALALVCGGLLLFAFQQAARAATLTVTNANDSGEGSLRQAIADAFDGDTITFAGDYTIYLDSQLELTKTLTIDGSGHAVTVSGDSGGDGSRNVRVFSIGSSGVVTLTHLSIVSGTATYGGGVYVSASGRLTVQRSFFANNHALISGGGIHNLSVVIVENSTFTGNSAGSYGAGIDNRNTFVAQHCTLSGNVGGGIYSFGSLRLYNTLIANNADGDCRLGGGGSVAANDHNLIKNVGYNACGLSHGAGGSLIGVNPLLGPLGDYGGPIQTFALLPGSPALDAGGAASCLPTDQRGIARPQVAACDIGA
ncbi:MAG: right-handed parallel beta-helix repeat-containing protein, partial [Anaerolineae bacterium]|nr:right-handed parallel beta-helix repeat-containing protein [Anaerolineae bacterium]